MGSFIDMGPFDTHLLFFPAMPLAMPVCQTTTIVFTFAVDAIMPRSLRALFLTRKPLLTLPFYLFPRLPSPALFSTLCGKRQHFHFPPPPPAKKIPFAATAHGVTWKDPYRWMSNISDPDFISYINQENSYADAFMRDTQELQKILYSEMVSRMPSNITTPPERWGPWSVIS